MNSLETPAFSRDRVLFSVGLTAMVLWGIAAVGILRFHLPLISLHWNFPQAVLGFGAGGLISMCSLGLYRSVPLFQAAVDANLSLVVKPLHRADMIWLGVLPSLSEELLFRGVLLPTLGMDGWGIGVSSLLFGSLHIMQWQHAIYALWALVVGLGFGGLTLYTENLLPSIVAHMTTNMVSGWIWKEYLQR